MSKVKTNTSMQIFTFLFIGGGRVGGYSFVKCSARWLNHFEIFRLFFQKKGDNIHVIAKSILQLLFSYFLAEKFSCLTMFGKEDFATVHNLRLISKTNFMLS